MRRSQGRDLEEYRPVMIQLTKSMAGIEILLLESCVTTTELQCALDMTVLCDEKLAAVPRSAVGIKKSMSAFWQGCSLQDLRCSCGHSLQSLRSGAN